MAINSITNTEEDVQIINCLIQALAYVQEVTVMQDSKSVVIGSHKVPHYSYKKTVIEGELRNTLLTKLEEKVNKL